MSALRPFPGRAAVASLRRRPLSPPSRAALVGFAVAALFGAWLRWPGVHGGFYLDDAVQIAMLRHDFPAPRSPFDLFRFADAARDGSALVDFGYDPWWTEPGYKVALFRPLSSALTALDYRLFGLDALGFHLHSVLWSIALVGAAALFLWRTVPRAAVPLAIVLFALDEGQTAPVVWLANRSTLVSSTFGFLALFARSLSETSRRRGLLAFAEAGAFLLAFLGGEYGYGFVAYAFASEALSSKSWRDRAVGLLPAALPAILCLAGSALAGYGVHGSGSYLSPFESPERFLEAVRARVPALYGDLFLGRPALDWVTNPKGRAVQEIVGLIGLAVFVVLTRWTARRLAPNEQRRLHALALGAALAAVPQATGMPEDRLLVAAAAGASGVFATFLTEVWRGRASLFAFRNPGGVLETCAALLSAVVAASIVKVHAIDAPIRSRGVAEWFARSAPRLRAWADDAEIPEPGPGLERVVLVAGADFTTAANVPWLRALDGHPLPRSYFRLSASSGVHELVRTAPNAIELKILTSDTESVFSGGLYRSEGRRIHRGDEFDAGLVKVEVLLADHRNPRWLRFTFDRNLEDSALVFLYPMGGRIRKIVLPPTGEHVRLPPPEQPPL